MAHAAIPDLTLDFGALLGAERIRRPNPIESRACELVVEPENADEIAEIVRKCERDKITLAPIGASRTLANIRRIPVAIGISLARMTRVVAYEPDDMTVVTQAGMTLGALNASLAPHGQRLPIDPASPTTVTIGATIGAAKAGPLRLSEGLVRDLLIGIQFVGHGGRITRAGGRVVKNVAGYDLMKVLTGSYGTPGIVTEAAFKVRPIPELCAIAMRRCERSEDAFDFAGKLNDALPLAHLEVLSAHAGAAFGEGSVVIAGFSGNRAEIEYQRARTEEIAGSTETFEGDRARELYERLRDLDFPGDAIVAQIAVPPAELARSLTDCATEFRAHAGSGAAQIWTKAGDGDTARTTIARWRAIAARARGHVRILSAPPAIRPGLRFFDNPNEGAMKLMRRLKASFDPANIFNPGCFVGGL